MDFATSITLLLFRSQDAYTVLPSTGSTLICTSICPDPGGAMMRGDDQVLPLSLLTTRNMVGLGQMGQPRIVTSVAFVYWGIRIYACPYRSAAIEGTHWAPNVNPTLGCGCDIGGWTSVSRTLA